MNKILLSLLFCFSIVVAETINGIAITINDDPITIYDIENKMRQKGVDKNKAVGLIIDELLYKQLLRKNNISADVFDVNDYIEKLAQRNGMDSHTFKSVVKQRYPDYELFEKEAKEAVLRDKLLKKIVKGNLKIANEEDMKVYYRNHQDKFSTAKSFEIIKYSSKDKRTLISIRKNPLLNFDNVEKENLELETNSVSPQLQYLLNNTKKGDFTPIFVADKMYNTIYMQEKLGNAVLDYDSVKQLIFSEIMQQREQKYLKDFFEKQKLTADIKIIR